MLTEQTYQPDTALPLGRSLPQMSFKLATANTTMSVAELRLALNQAIAEINRLRTREAQLMVSISISALNEYEAALPMRFEEVG
jgi:hypothetical protein